MFNLPLPVTYITYHLYAIYFDVCLVFCSYFVISPLYQNSQRGSSSRNQKHTFLLLPVGLIIH